MGTYSTGMKQRVKLAQALVHDPVLAFLDEPTAGLDPMGRRDMLELIRRVGRDFGISIVISTHLMGDVERTCDAVVVLDAGKVLRTGAVAGLTEETESVLVDLVEGADVLAAALERRGLAPRVDGNRLTLEQRLGRGLRHAARHDRRDERAALPARAGAAHAGAGLHRRAAPRERSGLRRDLRSRLPAVRGRAHGPLDAPARDLARRGPHLARAGPRRRGEDRAVAADRVRPRPGGRPRRDRRLRGLGGDEPGRLRPALLRRVLRVRRRAAQPLRGHHRAAARVSRPARRRALAVRRAADHTARLPLVALAGVLHGDPPRRLDSRGGCSSPGTRSMPRAPVRTFARTGTSSRATSARPC